MIDLKAKPFYLNDEQITWVEETKAAMNQDEKIGQMFVILKAIPGADENMVKGMLAQSHQGGLRWQGGDMEAVYQQNTTFQKFSKIPLLIAANCDDGGNGCLPNGTYVATAAECGAGEGTENAYHLGLVAGREASAIGCNWMFNPVVDVYKNWRNTIVNTRAFSSDPQKVLDNARAYIRGIKDANPNMAATAKHFPGDGMEELDQHLALGVNGLSPEDWESSYGMIYRTLINEGLEAVMVGHFAMPEYSRKLRPGIKNEEIMPATLAPELLTDLLRGDMGFNGVIITDASHMVGMTAMKKRSEAIPLAIAAGCDMILFANDMAEDMQFVKAALENGTLTQERVEDAVTRILAMKAHLNLNKEETLVPDRALMEKVGCEEHKKYSEQAADTCITLVKDTRSYLPLNPAEKKRCFLVYVGSSPISKGWKGDPVKQVLVEELERAGFDVDVCPNFHELEVENGVSFWNSVKMMDHSPRQGFIDSHDFALIVINVKGYAQENWVRVKWSCNHSMELPWYNEEIPTIGMSLNYTNHLIDIPQVHTFINAYAPQRDHIRAAIEKMTGKSEFKGHAEDYVFCDRWDTRL
ncbi:MAG: glycosyl hydrolase [Lachnospiraceae bacterium]|nr:glycosyl hydrolase [Lachnospiraceae bacterium]